MSRRAAEWGFELFLDPTMTAVRREFSVERALRGTGFGLGGRVVDRLRENNDALERQLVAGEFDAYRERSLAQFRVLLDAVESDEEIAAFADELLAHDSYVEAIDETATPAQRAAVAEDVLARLDRLGTGLAPILDRPEDDFWAAAAGAYSQVAATKLVQEAFPFTEPLSTHRGVLTFEVEADPNELLDSALLPTLPSASIDYTDEAIHAMTWAERQVVADLTEEVRSRFDADER